MNMFGCSDSFDAFFSICSSKEQPNSNNIGGYSQEFQAMLDSLDNDDSSENIGTIPTERKRRLRLDQVKALERHFEVENKLEPKRKMKIAAELELEPRQVTIWFQNRRARWKTKQLEKDYGLLKFNYNALKLDYDVLEKENKSLALKLRKLREKISREELERKKRNLIDDSNGVGNEGRNGNCFELSDEKVICEEESLFIINEEEPCNFCSVDQAPSLHW